MLIKNKFINLPLMPTDGAPAATACNAYSICTSFPEGLQWNHTKKIKNGLNLKSKDYHKHKLVNLPNQGPVLNRTWIYLVLIWYKYNYTLHSMAFTVLRMLG